MLLVKDHQVTFQGTPYLGLVLLGEPGYFFEEGDQFCCGWRGNQFVVETGRLLVGLR
ncbi:hypothetical protein V7I75_31835 [Pseudomonas aeruginosa]|uniref:hypothetical protein n=1 Tax=Pseudomonas aeruginosa TaxID=287 RepID=UPI00290E7DBB|nr:hypothetical protein [Pseudomonas aeruginosa]ELQ7934788.1 hypothetical protein [Pseudomonas aeruginosa]ELY3941963.1 hypothetical protein [Pseudomonas aeruginosa]EMC8226861.1 hypothetical protein [Pseudomonas aeruginosa]EMC8460316.1 hypothetical protein [Pseudomonas aeruginosa]